MVFSSHSLWLYVVLKKFPHCARPSLKKSIRNNYMFCILKNFRAARPSLKKSITTIVLYLENTHFPRCACGLYHHIEKWAGRFAENWRFSKANI